MTKLLTTLRSRIDLSDIKFAFKAKQTPPCILFPFFVTLNLLLYTDRGIIPGASVEFSSFAAGASDSPGFIRGSPDAGLGILQASFIGGYSVAIVICGHFVHVIPWRKMTSVGFGIWILSVFMSGLSEAADSFTMLLIGRVLSGVAEASFHVVAPPMFQDRGGKNAALWLSIYLSAMPLGMALGYVFGSEVANNPSLGWYWAFLIEGLVATPIMIFQLMFIRDNKNGGVFAPYETKPSVDASKEIDMNDAATDIVSNSSSDREKRNDMIQNEAIANSHPTFLDEIRICLSSHILISIIIAQAICIAVVSVMSTFGGAFLLALRIFDNEQAGARSFGITAALAGVIGTPLGGVAMDKVLSRNKRRKRKDTLTNMEQLVHVLPYITLFVTVGITLCYPTLFFDAALPFLGFLFVGWTILFMSQSGITYCIMLSVNEHHRPNAIAFSTLMSHVLGDVPAPILFGFLKDELAPACNIVNGAFVDDLRCAEEHLGIRGTMAIAYAWITLSIVFFEMARRLAKQEYELTKADQAEQAKKALEENGVEFPVSSNGGPKEFSVAGNNDPDITIIHLDDKGTVDVAQYC